MLFFQIQKNVKTGASDRTQQLSQMFTSFPTEFIMAQVKFLNSGIALNVKILITCSLKNMQMHKLN